MPCLKEVRGEINDVIPVRISLIKEGGRQESFKKNWWIYPFLQALLYLVIYRRNILQKKLNRFMCQHTHIPNLNCLQYPGIQRL